MSTLARPFGLLLTRADSIETGTSEIRKNIPGERVLGLPPEQHLDRDLAGKDTPRKIGPPETRDDSGCERRRRALNSPLASPTGQWKDSPVLVDTYFARQPILDVDRNVRAYEVLYRPGPRALSAGNPDGRVATANVLAGAFGDVELPDLLSGLPGFVNLPREFLLDRSLLAFPPDRVAAEILEDVVDDSEVVSALTELRSVGYKVALDDFRLGDGRNGLLPYADIVKVDVLEHDSFDLERTARVLKAMGVRMLAEKVETTEEFERCRRFGFELFQGYFFARPELVTARRLDEGRGRLVQLLAEFHRPDVDAERVGRVVEGHPSLAHQLLRVLNTSPTGFTPRIESIREAVTSLGVRRVTELAGVLVLAAQDHKPIELVSLGLTRARMCELMARTLGREDAASFFTVGVFSVLDALADQPMVDVVRFLPLADDIVAALVDRSGIKGQVLESAIAYERADWERLPDVGVDARSLSIAYLEAIDYTSSMLSIARA